MYMPSLFDLAVLRMLRQAGYARKSQVVAWTDSSTGYVNESMARMKSAGLVDHATVPADLLGDDGRIRRSLTEVWFATASGLRHLEPAVLPGTDNEVTIRPLRPTGTLTSHTLAVADGMTALRHWGWDVASERVVRAAEQSTKLRPMQARHWTVATSTRILGDESLSNGRTPAASRVPDIVATGPCELSVEVELATTKPRGELLRVLATYRDAGRVQAWWVQSSTILSALIKLAGEHLGVTGDWRGNGASRTWVSADQSIFFARYVPGPRVAAGHDPKATIPTSPPFGIRAERSTVARDEWLVSEDAAKLTEHRARRRAEHDQHAVAEAALIERATREGLAPGTYRVGSTLRRWDGQRWGAPEPLAA